MDVIVGVAVTGRVARLAMIGAGGQVFDQYALDLPDDAMTDLADTIMRFNQLVPAAVVTKLYARRSVSGSPLSSSI